jgi:RNA polymerase sigma-70 factor (ECF subfamily)
MAIDMSLETEPIVPTEELLLLERLRQGDEAAFQVLVDRYHAGMVRLAMAFVANRAAAEDVAQEAWLGVLRGLPTFEGRSSLRTWIYRIVMNRAKTRGLRDGRTISFTDLGQTSAEADDTNESSEYFIAPGQARAGHWISSPHSWQELPEERMLALEVRNIIHQEIAHLPESQRAVISLRDLEGWSSPEVCNVLGLSETNQRVLLHRARARIRHSLEQYLAPDGERAHATM